MEERQAVGEGDWTKNWREGRVVVVGGGRGRKCEEQKINEREEGRGWKFSREKNALWATKLMARCTDERAKCSPRDITWFLSRRQLRSRNLVISFTANPRCSDRVVTSDLNSSRPIDLIERNVETIHQPTVRSSSIKIETMRQRHLPSLYGPSLGASIARWFKGREEKKKKGLLNRSCNRCMLVSLKVIFKNRYLTLLNLCVLIFSSWKYPWR